MKAYKAINDDELSRFEGTRLFFSAHKVGVYFCKSNEEFYLPGRAWKESPDHPTLLNVPRMVPAGVLLTIRVEYDEHRAEVEWDERVYQINWHQFERVKKKVTFIC